MDPNTRIGRKAQVFYKGGISGEEPVDNHSHGNPVELVLGVGDVPPGLDRAFLEMSVGEERTVVIPPSLGYGEHDKAGVQIYPRTLSPAFEKIQGKGCAFTATVVEPAAVQTSNLAEKTIL